MTECKAQSIDRLITQHEVELITGLKPSTLANWRCKKIGIPFVKVGSKAVRYKVSEVIRYIEALKSEV